MWINLMVVMNTEWTIQCNELNFWTMNDFYVNERFLR